MEQINVAYLRKQMAEEILDCYKFESEKEIFTLIRFCLACDGLLDFPDAHANGTLKSFCEKIKEAENAR